MHAKMVRAKKIDKIGTTNKMVIERLKKKKS
jgi:hypothetical protein